MPSVREPSFVFYDGPSVLPGHEGPAVLGVCTPVAATPNRKLGEMWQAWILVKATAPGIANRLDVDRAICGECRHRKGDAGEGRTCYVAVWKGPTSIWRREYRNPYPRYTPRQTQAALTGEVLRIGAYGDPTAIPFDVWQGFRSVLAGWTGYTHFWRTCDPRFRTFLMTSVESPREATEAQARGWRTFRCRSPHEPVMTEETICPASEEGGHAAVCETCQLCRGTRVSAKSVAIVAHGRTALRFIKSRHMASLLHGEET